MCGWKMKMIKAFYTYTFMTKAVDALEDLQNDEYTRFTIFTHIIVSKICAKTTEQ